MNNLYKILLLIIIVPPCAGMEKSPNLAIYKSGDIDPFFAARQKRLDVIARLICLFDFNAREQSTGNTVLHYAVLLNDEKMIGFLLNSRRVDPSIKNDSGHSSFDIARNSENRRTIALFEKFIAHKNSLQKSTGNITRKSN